MHACTSNETRRRGPHFSNRWRESVSWTRVRGGIRIDQRNGRVLVPCGRASWGSSSGQSHSGAAAQRKEAPFSVTVAPEPRDLRDPHPRQGSPAAPSRAIGPEPRNVAQCLSRAKHDAQLRLRDVTVLARLLCRTVNQGDGRARRNFVTLRQEAQIKRKQSTVHWCRWPHPPPCRLTVLPAPQSRRRRPC